MDLTWITEALGRPSLGWRDVIDIALVSLLIYEVLVLIRGTRAVQMAVGAGLAVALFYLSNILQLETVNWLIRNMVGYVVFAAIVLFQSDIRRALAHLGRAPFFRYLAKGETVDETVEEIAVAAQMLSSQRTGAIVVVERQIGLRNYSEGGIPLDAQISYDLLVTSSRSRSPLHDGAVIIQENRISAAACFLPLTVNPRLSKDLGTRHRAAIGLTEENDALAVVVSEETGFISLVLDGRVERNITPEHLRVRLRELAPAAPLAEEPVRPPGRAVTMRVRVFRNLGLKVLSIALATLIWGLVAGSARRGALAAGAARDPQIPDQLELLGEPASLVDVRLRGTSGALGQSARHRPGRRDRPPRRTPRPRGLFHLLSDDVWCQRAWTVVQMSPATLSSDLRDVRTSDRARQCPTSTTSRRPVRGRRTSTANPATVEVSGPFGGEQCHRSHHRAGERAGRDQAGDRHGDRRRAD